MTEDRVPLYVRLPRAQARALDQLVGSTGRRKQQLVSQLLGEQLGVGRIDIRDSAPGEEDAVLTLEELAELLRVSPDDVAARARSGELPGRRLGGQWRFSRAAVLRWLGQGGDAPGAAGDDGR